MTQTFNFETNIEKRMPDTGKVYFVDRMTSDYAQVHPFDVDGFIEQVYEHWNGEESRKTIRQYFNYGLGRKGEKFSTHCPAKHRDKVVKDPKTGIGQIEFGKWPEHVGGLRPSLIEAWNKGAEYHTKGFRQGDVLPAKLPVCKITRLGNGSEWIALFPKDADLLNTNGHKWTQMATNESNAQPLPSHQGEGAGVGSETPILPDSLDTASEDSCQILEDCDTTGDPVMASEQNDAPVSSIAVAVSDNAPTEEDPAPRRGTAGGERRMSFLEMEEERKRRQTEQANRSYARLYGSPAITIDNSHDHSDRNRKIFAAVATAAVFIVLVNTVGLFGIAAIGLIAGGIVK